MTVTYAEIAETLPASTRVALPCAESANHQHLWQEERVVFGPAGQILAVLSEPYWWCTYCRAATWDRPIPAVDRPWAIITAAQFLKETS